MYWSWSGCVVIRHAYTCIGCICGTTSCCRNGDAYNDTIRQSKQDCSRKSFLSIGKLAYSVYLVHWPTYVYFRHVGRAMRIELFENPCILMATSILLGLCLNKLIEIRFRPKRDAPVSVVNTFPVVALTIATITIAWKGKTTAGWKFRGTQKSKRIKAAIAEMYCSEKGVRLG